MSTISATSLRDPRALGILAAFIVVVVAVGGLIGTITAPGEWFESLQKPPFNPPAWVFAPVWTALYVLIAIAGWRTCMADPRGLAMKLWVAQMLLNWLWSPVWFGLHLLWPAFVVILALDIVVIVFIIDRWKADRLSALLFLPYLAWLAFASLLNFSIALLN
jgi:benzodiazapine receptor